MDDPIAQQNWWSELMPYVKNQAIFVCPSATNTQYVEPGHADTSYMANWWVVYDGSTSLGMVQQPARCPIYVDAGAPWSGAWTYDGRDGTFPIAIHSNGINADYVDGHSKWTHIQPVKQFADGTFWAIDWWACYGAYAYTTSTCPASSQ